jgi:predicted lysophospholipase L1 biosynthesis ABC-type transport system permease subunit
MRLALGASRATLVRLTFLEAARLSYVAGAGAVVLAWLALRVVRRGMVVSLPRLPEVSLDIVTLVIVAAVAAVCVIAIAIGPA